MHGHAWHVHANITPIMQIKLLDQEAAREKALVDFTWEKSSFSRNFKTAKSTEDFQEEWIRQVLPRMDSKTGKCMTITTELFSAS